MSVPRQFLPVALALCLVAGSGGALAQVVQEAQDTQKAREAQERKPLPDGVVTAPVVVDGVTLLRLRGAGPYAAEQRAAVVARRVVEAAQNPSFDPADLRSVEVEAEGETRIMAGSSIIVRLVDADGELESIDRKTLAKISLETLRGAMVSYRAARTREALLGSAGRAALALVLAAFAVFAFLRLGRRGERWLEGRLRARLPSVTIQSFELLRAERLWRLFHDVAKFVKGIILILTGYFVLHYVLAQFPWTRGVADQLAGWLLNPLRMLGRAFVAELPNLAFLAVLYFVTRSVLRLMRLFFDAVRRGDVVLEGFDRDWADPTYKLVRLAAAAFAIVIAYPYIPGSSTEAFKGLSIFFGLLLSLGAASVIGNIIAGFAMIYRRAFREGDIIRIGDTIGRVTSMRLVVTHVRTAKNEEVVVPNSKLLSDEIVNYSTLARDQGLILHTTVGIGYGTPWRQVEALLLEASRRTPGLRAEPRPFVLQKALGEFAVTYEINVPCDDPRQMPYLYAELHRRILDVFNEHGVQIMTPAYEGDPEQPKIVPSEDWYRAPAVRE